eukprot:140068-Chlamydomonas_euryale.AAC.4
MRFTLTCIAAEVQEALNGVVLSCWHTADVLVQVCDPFESTLTEECDRGTTSTLLHACHVPALRPPRLKRVACPTAHAALQGTRAHARRLADCVVYHVMLWDALSNAHNQLQLSLHSFQDGCCRASRWHVDDRCMAAGFRLGLLD